MKNYRLFLRWLVCRHCSANKCSIPRCLFRTEQSSRHKGASGCDFHAKSNPSQPWHILFSKLRPPHKRDPLQKKFKIVSHVFSCDKKRRRRSTSTPWIKDEIDPFRHSVRERRVGWQIFSIDIELPHSDYACCQGANLNARHREVKNGHEIDIELSSFFVFQHTCTLMERSPEATSLAHQPPAGRDVLLLLSTGTYNCVPLFGLGNLASNKFSKHEWEHVILDVHQVRLFVTVPHIPATVKMRETASVAGSKLRLSFNRRWKGWPRRTTRLAPVGRSIIS